MFENIGNGGCRLTDLAARSDVTHQSMSELIGILERRGYVERRRDPSDGRVRLVYLTDAGRKLRDLGSTHIRKIETEWQQRRDRAGLRTPLRPVLVAALEATDGAAAR